MNEHTEHLIRVRGAKVWNSIPMEARSFSYYQIKEKLACHSKQRLLVRPHLCNYGEVDYLCHKL